MHFTIRPRQQHVLHGQFIASYTCTGRVQRAMNLLDTLQHLLYSVLVPATAAAHGFRPREPLIHTGSNQPDPTRQSSPQGLRRVLGMRDLVFMIVGTVIGSGIFLVPGPILRDVGHSVPEAFAV